MKKKISRQKLRDVKESQDIRYKTVKIVEENITLRDLSCSQTCRTKFAKMAILAEMICGLNWVLIKFPMTFFIETTTRKPEILKVIEKKKL